MSPNMSVEPLCLSDRTRSFGGGPRMTSQQSLAWQLDMQSRAALMAELQPRPPVPGLAHLLAPRPATGGAA